MEMIGNLLRLVGEEERSERDNQMMERSYFNYRLVREIIIIDLDCLNVVGKECDTS